MRQTGLLGGHGVMKGGSMTAPLRGCNDCGCAAMMPRSTRART